MKNLYRYQDQISVVLVFLTAFCFSLLQAGLIAWISFKVVLVTMLIWLVFFFNNMIHPKLVRYIICGLLSIMSLYLIIYT